MAILMDTILFTCPQCGNLEFTVELKKSFVEHTHANGKNLIENTKKEILVCCACGTKIDAQDNELTIIQTGE